MCTNVWQVALLLSTLFISDLWGGTWSIEQITKTKTGETKTEETKTEAGDTSEPKTDKTEAGDKSKTEPKTDGDKSKTDSKTDPKTDKTETGDKPKTGDKTKTKKTGDKTKDKAYKTQNSIFRPEFQKPLQPFLVRLRKTLLTKEMWTGGRGATQRATVAVKKLLEELDLVKLPGDS